ncbi:hypothetical protein [Hymenobacter pini]|uniref:hypothetical protein n=1 Tax=Hymenobacter pini TaxID=2880879 RepID=UPI001CF5A827|nr:hypothetical protein [Hymenobacter pini]MCA8830501.1 hypothetical protein [Hymenobacter pini]
MAVAPALLLELQALGQRLMEATEAEEADGRGPLDAAQRFLFTYLPQEPAVPHRADELLELLAPSPHVHHSWAGQRQLVLEGLTLLHQVWLR